MNSSIVAEDEKSNNATEAKTGGIRDQEDDELKLWEEPPKVDRKPIRDAIKVSENRRFDKYIYTVFGDNTIEIVKYTGRARDVSIPREIDGMKVTTIGEGAFYYNNKLRSAVVPDTVFYIGDRAFARCASLNAIHIPDSVKIIGDYAFENTDWFKTRREDFVIVGDGVLIAYNSKNGDVRIPAAVKSISSAFFRCGRMTSLIIPGSVRHMADYAFMFCRNMKRLIVEDGAGPLSDCAFAGCTGLIEASIGKNVASLGDYIFWKCNHLEKVTLSDGLDKIGIGAFWICSSLTTVNIPETVRYIDRWAFYHCRSLENLYIPPGVRIFGNNLFQTCDKLTVFCKPGSPAESYAKSEGVRVEYYTQ